MYLYDGDSYCKEDGLPIEMSPGGHLNIKMSSYHCRDPHVKDKSKRSRDRLIFNMGISIPRKDGLYIETGPWGPSHSKDVVWPV